MLDNTNEPGTQNISGLFHPPSASEIALIQAKAEELVKMGLMPLATIPYLKRAITHVGQDMFLPFQERHVFYDFLFAYLSLVMSDPTISRLVKQRTMMKKYTNEETIPTTDNDGDNDMADAGEALSQALDPDYSSVVHDCDDPIVTGKSSFTVVMYRKKVLDPQEVGMPDGTQIDMTKMNPAQNKNNIARTTAEETIKEGRKQVLPLSTPDVDKEPIGTLNTMANIVVNKEKAGAKITDADRALASRARSALRKKKRQAGITEDVLTRIGKNYGTLAAKILVNVAR